MKTETDTTVIPFSKHIWNVVNSVIYFVSCPLHGLWISAIHNMRQKQILFSA